MAAKWQQWMPFYVDRFRGSPDVQAMHPAARMGYLYLCSAAWQSEDCTVPDDDIELATLSGLGDEMWAIYGLRIRRKFIPVAGCKLMNIVTRDEWLRAKKTFEDNKQARSDAGKKGNEKRWNRKSDEMDRNCDKKRRKRDEKPSQNIATGTETLTLTEKEEKPSRAKPECDPRHAGFKEAVMAYAAHKRVTLAWDGSEAKALDLMLKSAPKLTLAEFQACLNNRSRSHGTTHGDRPRVWLPNILKYQQGPLDQFNKLAGSAQDLRPDASVGMKPHLSATEPDDGSRIAYWRTQKERGNAMYRDCPNDVKRLLEAQG